eukprot:CAMPEP_0171235978 /NCGR_PEP_ID=MMETSP0790-20130122/42218_1 /TAXON_ID=2925 /ORGANISM="Alexandrium catenella, Strain OF101" /LENGTH=254 /DNA_ID=CAMNT_0011702293 /DNA_START=56 /DNA_END=821 /DNA_ORIENTATION=+
MIIRRVYAELQGRTEGGTREGKADGALLDPACVDHLPADAGAEEPLEPAVRHYLHPLAVKASPSNLNKEAVDIRPRWLPDEALADVLHQRMGRPLVLAVTAEQHAHTARRCSLLEPVECRAELLNAKEALRGALALAPSALMGGRHEPAVEDDTLGGSFCSQLCLSPNKCGKGEASPSCGMDAAGFLVLTVALAQLNASAKDCASSAASWPNNTVPRVAPAAACANPSMDLAVDRRPLAEDVADGLLGVLGMSS